LESCMCGGDSPSHFDWEDISLTTVDRDFKTVMPNQKIQFQAVSFRFYIEGIFLANRFSVSSALLACDPDPAISIRLIQEIQIISSNDFITESKTYAAHSDIAELFGTYEFSTLPEFISNAKLYNNFTFILNAQPQGEQQHELKFVFKLDDGRVFETMASLILTP